MILNRSAEYALRAVLFIARHRRAGPQNADAIAEAIGVPRNYLGKVLNQLVRARVLTSTRGPGGGFKLAVPASLLVLAAVIAPFQELPARTACLLGDRACNESRPCAAHERWRRMAAPVAKFFRNTTIERMLREAP